jgi:hypothetical protein
MFCNLHPGPITSASNYEASFLDQTTIRTWHILLGFYPSVQITTIANLCHTIAWKINSDPNISLDVIEYLARPMWLRMMRLPWILGCETGHVCNKLYTLPYPPGRPHQAKFEHLKILPLYRRLPPCEFIEVQCIRAILTIPMHPHFSDKLSKGSIPGWVHFFLFFLSCTIYILCTSLWLIIALGLHRNSINGMHISTYAMDTVQPWIST